VETWGLPELAARPRDVAGVIEFHVEVGLAGGEALPRPRPKQQPTKMSLSPSRPRSSRGMHRGAFCKGGESLP
jgi:hypothetical protein